MAVLYTFPDAQRPENSNAVGVCGKVSSNPSKEYLKITRQIFDYLRTTKQIKLTLRGNKNQQIRAFSDADWGRNLVDRKSTTGYVVLCGSSPISWNSDEQGCVAGSTIEAEHVALDSSVKETV